MLIGRLSLISLLIIGNEVLSAQIEETNLKHMLKVLGKAGYPVDEVRMVRDHVDTIANAVRDLSARSQFVVSTGGIGPTHDDVTLKAYAAAFQSPLRENQELIQTMKGYFGENLKPSTLAMALVPECANLVPCNYSKWPVIKVKNCFVLPGLPEIFLKKFKGVVEALPPVSGLYYAELFTSSDEMAFAESLSLIQEKFGHVEIGSYPTYDRSVFAARVTLKCEAQSDIQTVFDLLQDMFKELGTLVNKIPPERYDPDKAQASKTF